LDNLQLTVTLLNNAGDLMLSQQEFSLDHLTPTRFEEFCYDLLVEMGFSNVTWRKGTGMKASPADQGRDIECELLKNDVGEKYFEKWFVEAKHYKAGVPPDKLQAAITWAQSERPDVLLFIVSNFLSNAAKSYLKKYKENNKPAFRIRVFERPELERFTAEKSQLLHKYKVSRPYKFLSLLHPAHIEYLKFPALNTLDYFFEVLDTLEPNKRDRIFASTYLFVGAPRFRRPCNDNEKIGDLMVDRCNYDTFKKKCYELREQTTEVFLIPSIMNFTLQILLDYGDQFSLDSKIERNKLLIASLEKSKKDTGAESTKEMIERVKGLIEKLPQRTKEYYNLYEEFCEFVIPRLFLEEFEISRMDS